MKWKWTPLAGEEKGGGLAPDSGTGLRRLMGCADVGYQTRPSHFGEQLIWRCGDLSSSPAPQEPGNLLGELEKSFHVAVFGRSLPFSPSPPRRMSRDGMQRHLLALLHRGGSLGGKFRARSFLMAPCVSEHVPGRVNSVTRVSLNVLKLLDVSLNVLKLLDGSTRVGTAWYLKKKSFTADAFFEVWGRSGEQIRR